jgi:hypothetical protein
VSARGGREQGCRNYRFGNLRYRIAAGAPLAAAALAAALLGAGCTPSFQAVEQVVDLRILAVQAEPAETLIPLDGGVPADITITALIGDPVHPTAPLTIQPLVCLPGDGARCTGTTLLTASGQPFFRVVDVPQAQGNAAFSMFGQFTDPTSFTSVVNLLNAAVAADKLHGAAGIQLQLELDVFDGLEPYGVQTAIKTLIFRPETPGGNPDLNHNPRVAQTLLRDANYLAAGSLAPGATLCLNPGEVLGLRPALPGTPVDAGDPDHRFDTPDGIETYSTIDLSGNPITLPEYPSWSFYTTEGCDLDTATASEPLQGVQAPPAGLLRITAQQLTSGTFWAVVRDGRGGEAWITHPWIIQADPCPSSVVEPGPVLR